ncbi:unnamed protein product, partial [Durusdinium trenchii]
HQTRNEAHKMDHNESLRDHRVFKNSFWGMFYAEYNHIVNYFLRHRNKLLPRAFRVDDRIAPVLDGIVSFVAVVTENTPCQIIPVGLQDKMPEHVGRIEKELQRLRETMCGPTSLLGPCHDRDGSAILPPPEGAPPLLGKVVVWREARLKRARGAPIRRLTGEAGEMVEAWGDLRDMVINLQNIYEAVSLQTAFLDDATSTSGHEREVYTTETVNAARAEDPVMYGYMLRTADTERVARSNRPIGLGFMPFPFAGFIAKLCKMTSVPLYDYASPIYNIRGTIKVNATTCSLSIGPVSSWNIADTLDGDHLAVFKKLFETVRLEWARFANPDLLLQVQRCNPSADDLVSLSMRLKVNSEFRAAQRNEPPPEKPRKIPNMGMDDFHRPHTTPTADVFVVAMLENFLNQIPGASIACDHPLFEQFFRAEAKREQAEKELLREIEAEEAARARAETKAARKRVKAKERAQLRNAASVTVQAWWRRVHAQAERLRVQGAIGAIQAWWRPRHTRATLLRQGAQRKIQAWWRELRRARTEQLLRLALPAPQKPLSPAKAEPVAPPQKEGQKEAAAVGAAWADLHRFCAQLGEFNKEVMDKAAALTELQDCVQKQVERVPLLVQAEVERLRRELTHAKCSNLLWRIQSLLECLLVQNFPHDPFLQAQRDHNGYVPFGLLLSIPPVQNLMRGFQESHHLNVLFIVCNRSPWLDSAPYGAAWGAGFEHWPIPGGV